MKILQLVATLDPSKGGPVEGIRQVSCAMERLGHQVEFASLDDSGVLWIKDFPFMVHALGPSVLSYNFSTRLVAWLRQNAGKYDAVVVHGLWSFNTFGAWLALSGGAVPYFVFLHGSLGAWFKENYPLKHLKKWIYWPWGGYPVLCDAKAVLFTCEEEKISARKSFWLYKCNEITVGFGAPTPKGNSGLQKREFRLRFPDLKEKRLILFMGRIHPVKGCDLLIEAFAKVAGRDPNLHLVMAGPDQVGLRRELTVLSEQLGIADRITWAGMIFGDMKWGAYHAAEVFALPSHHENFGVVVAEALACGLPVLISNKVNIWREIVADGAGLVANDDTDGTVSLLQRWIGMETEARDAMKRNAVDCFHKRFEISKFAVNFVEALSRFKNEVQF